MPHFMTQALVHHVGSSLASNQGLVQKLTGGGVPHPVVELYLVLPRC